MANPPAEVLIFEGIATLDLGDLGTRDVYLTARTQAIGYTIRWFGTFTWIGEVPKGLFHDEVLDVLLSDGRAGKMRLPHPPVEDDTWEFLGEGLPPGFEWLPMEQPMVTAELASIEIPRWRVWCSRVLNLTSFGSLMAAIWWEGHGWPLVLTSGALWFAATSLNSRRAGKQLPEVSLDVPR
jgi:hypothetical protein